MQIRAAFSCLFRGLISSGHVSEPYCRRINRLTLFCNLQFVDTTNMVTSSRLRRGKRKMTADKTQLCNHRASGDAGNGVAPSAYRDGRNRRVAAIVQNAVLFLFCPILLTLIALRFTPFTRGEMRVGLCFELPFFFWFAFVGCRSGLQFFRWFQAVVLNFICLMPLMLTGYWIAAGLVWLLLLVSEVVLTRAMFLVNTIVCLLTLLVLSGAAVLMIGWANSWDGHHAELEALGYGILAVGWLSALMSLLLRCFVHRRTCAKNRREEETK